MTTERTISMEEKRRKFVLDKRAGGSLVAGFAALLSVAEPPARMNVSRGSTASALRGDMARIGADMRRVMQRELNSGQKKVAQKRK